MIPKDATLEKLAAGFAWSEGPVWNRKENYLLFSDIPRNRVMQWKSDSLKVFLKPSGYTGHTPRGGESGSNALAYDREGRLVLCQHGDRRIARLEKDGRFATIADKFEGKRFNSPNDLCFKSNGDLYFTDPPYGLEKNWDDPARELDFCGVFRVKPDGKVELMTKELARPNGICFSPDEKLLYVGTSDPQQPIWKAYEVKDDGTLGNSRVFFDSSAMGQGESAGTARRDEVRPPREPVRDGAGRLAYLRPDGTHLGRIDTGERTANCTGETTARRSTSPRTCIFAESRRRPRGTAGEAGGAGSREQELAGGSRRQPRGRLVVASIVIAASSHRPVHPASEIIAHHYGFSGGLASTWWSWSSVWRWLASDLA